VIVIKRIKNILFFLLISLLIVFLLVKLGIISFILGLLKSLFPIIVALFISVCMESIISKFVNKGYSRKCVTVFCYLGLTILAIGLLALFIAPFTKQIQVFINTLPSLISDIEQLFKKVNINFNSDNLLDSLQIRIDKVIEYFSNSFGFIIDFGIAFSAAFFISYDYDNLKEKIKSKIPNIIKEETIYFFSKYFPFFSKYIYSLLVDSLITFVISFILFTIFKVEYSLIGALIISITNLIPFIGALIGIIPLVVIGYSVSSYFAIISLVIVLLVQLIESNIIQPIIFNNVIKLHPIEGIAGVLLFSYMFSTLGMILSPLLVVAFKLLFVEKYPKANAHFNNASIQ